MLLKVVSMSRVVLDHKSSTGCQVSYQISSKLPVKSWLVTVSWIAGQQLESTAWRRDKMTGFPLALKHEFSFKYRGGTAASTG